MDKTNQNDNNSVSGVEDYQDGDEGIFNRANTIELAMNDYEFVNDELLMLDDEEVIQACSSSRQNQPSNQTGTKATNKKSSSLEEVENSVTNSALKEIQNANSSCGSVSKKNNSLLYKKAIDFNKLAYKNTYKMQRYFVLIAFMI
jgi:hypothetical protein